MSRPRAPSSRPAGASDRLNVTVQILTRPVPVERLRVVRAVRAALGQRRPADVSVVLLGDEAIADLHGRFLGDPRPTDVLTFDLRDDSRADALEGEIIISVETARRHARRLRIDAADEILRCCVHGVLHLLGYDDRTPAGRRRMRRAENRLLASL